MLNLILTEKKALTNKQTSYISMAYDGAYLYFLSENEPVITKYDLNFCIIEQTSLCQTYTAICYDCSENCFWASIDNNKICKLDPENFCEIDLIELKFNSYEKIKAICYDFHNNCLSIITNTKLYICNKDGYSITNCETSAKENNCALCCYNNQTIKISSYQDNDISIFKLLNTDFTTENINCLPKDYIANSMLSFCYNSKIHLLILAKKNKKYPYLIKYNIFN